MEWRANIWLRACRKLIMPSTLLFFCPEVTISYEYKVTSITYVTLKRGGGWRMENTRKRVVNLSERIQLLRKDTRAFVFILYTHSIENKSELQGLTITSEQNPDFMIQPYLKLINCNIALLYFRIKSSPHFI